MAKFHGKQTYIGAWHYVLLDILYTIPVLGLIFLLAHSFSDANENRKHYARSYFVRFLVVLLIIAAAVGVYFLVVGKTEFLAKFNDLVQIWKDLVNTFKPVKAVR